MMSAIFELELGPGQADGTFTVRVLRSVGGSQPTAEIALDVDEMLAHRALFEATVLSSAVATRRVLSEMEATVRQVGVRLFEAVFAGAIGGAYRTSSALAQERGTSLQLILRLTPELAALPWESLYDAESGAYLCRQEPLVRTIPAAYTAEPLAIDLPLRILGIVASPRDLQRLDTAAERDRLEQALRPQTDAGLVELVWLDDVSWSGVHGMLLDQSWHVLHFVGHGGFDVATDEGQLALVGEDGRADFVSASSLADLLNEAEPTPRLVVLNSCMSGAVSEDDLFSGTASALVRSGIHAVAAMQFAISDGAAINFARGFYTALARGRRVDEAVRSGRIGILGMGRGTLEWVTPVLYLRGGDSRIFDIARPATIPAPAPPDHEPTKETPARTAPLPAPPEEPPAPLPSDDATAPEAPPATGAPPAPAPPHDAPTPPAPDDASAPPLPDEAPAPPPPDEHEPKPDGLPQAVPSESDGSGEGGIEPPGGTGRRGRPSRRRIAIVIGAAAALVIGAAAALAIVWGFMASQGGGGVLYDAASADPSPQTAELPIPANESWTSTGLVCSAGDSLDITASGTVLHEADPNSTVSPDGLTDAYFHQWNVAGLPDANTVALIGSVGEEQPFFVVGSEFQGICPDTGPLSLGINDIGLEANSGEFQAVVTVTPTSKVVFPRIVTVPANATWTRMDIVCTTGDVLQFVASGTVQHGPTPDRTSGPGGTSIYEPEWNVATLEGANHASLIGSVAGQAPFVIGTASQVECPVDGLLLLGINDDGSDIGFNVGAFTVAVIKEESTD